MDPLLGAGIGLLGGVVNNLFAGQRQDEAQAFNAQQLAQSQAFNAEQAGINRTFAADQAGLSRNFNSQEAYFGRQFQDIMQANQYQRTVQDMRAAGLNPILAYRQGAGSTPSASTASSGASPSGSAASSGTTSITPAQTFDILGPAVNNAMQILKLENETKVANASADKLRAETSTETERPGLVSAQKATEEKRPALVERQTKLGKAETSESLQRQIIREPEAEKAEVERSLLNNQAYRILYGAGLVSQNAAKPVTDVGNALKSFVVPSFKERFKFRSDD
ncbi:DNA pilot protein [Blackfly microvirus SF02]|uniref:DNA pilot protein n=1 Tax=Blackfly microvirus SF02 TaxID=2576452 RepID=A0A4P8PTN8_9VIRU|nr:DNA pilot protein [Blackfly microvirus SF02]